MDFVLSLLLILLTPYFIICTLILLYRRQQRTSINGEYRPSVTVFIPTYNEETYIRAKLDNLLSQAYPIYEILIYDCSTDRTPLIVEELQSKYTQIKLIKEKERVGPARTFNQALIDAKCEIIVKTDADTMLRSPDAIKDLISNFYNAEIGAACAVYVKEKGFEKYFRRFMTMIQIAESNLDSTIISHPGLLAFRNSAVSLVDPNSMAEDTEEFILVRKNGFRAVVDASVKTEEEVPSHFLLRRKQRDRRAYGVIKAMAKNKDVFFNPRFGKYGLVIFPLEFFIMVMSPFILFALTGVSVYYLYQNYPPLLGLLAVPLSIVAKRSNILFAIIDTQISCLLATLKFLTNKGERTWNKVR